MSEEPTPSPAPTDEQTIDATAVAPISEGALPQDELHLLAVSGEERYELRGEIGRGGAGRVSEARDQRLRRDVAVKQLIRDDRASRARFMREAFLTARLQHPSIVPILDAGTSSDGDPFYAMPLVSGPSLAEVISETATLSDRLSLVPNVLAAVEAVAYAHSEHVIHRDLKPHNIVIGPFGETFVVDWGLAKDLALDGEDEPAFSDDLPMAPEATVAGAVLGTPAFMAPEQARGERADERTDVYGLGALLYHLLAGRAPYVADTAAAVLAKLEAGPPPGLRERVPDVPGELAAIVDKAMARRSSDRYADAGQVAIDLRRFQTGQLVGAHRYSARALFTRWLRRHRATVAVAALLGTALVVGGIVSVRNIVQARDEATAQRSDAVANRKRADKARRTSDDARKTLLHRLIVSSLDSDPTAAMAWLKQYGDETKEWGRVRVLAAAAQNRGVARHVWRAHAGRAVVNVAFSPDSKTIISSGGDGTLRRWRVRDGKSTIVADSGSGVVGVEHLGANVLTADRAGNVRVTPAAGGTSRAIVQHPARLLTLALSRSRHLLATGGNSGRVTIHSLRDNKSVQGDTTHDWFISTLAISPDERTVVSGAADNTVRAWRTDSGTGSLIGRMPNTVNKVAYSADGRHLAAVSIDGTMALWRTRDWKRQRTIRNTGAFAYAAWAPSRSVLVWSSGDVLHTLSAPAAAPSQFAKVDGVVTQLLYSPSGKLLAVATRMGELYVFEMDTGARRHLHGHVGAIRQVSFSPDEKWLTSASVDGTVRVWPARAPDTRTVWRHPNSIPMFEFDVSPNMRRIGMIGRDNTLHVFDQDTGKTTRYPDLVVRSPPAFSPDSKLIYFLTRDGAVVRWNLETDATQIIHQHRSRPDLCNARICQVAVSPDGVSIASTVGQTHLSLWRPGSTSQKLLHLPQGARRMTFSSDSKMLVAGDVKGGLTIWNLASGASYALPAAGSEIQELNILPGNREVVARSVNGHVHVWDLTSRTSRRFSKRATSSWGLAISTDGSLIAGGDADGTVTLFNRTTAGTQLFRSPGSAVRHLMFVDDDRFLVSSQVGSSLRLWHIASHESVGLRFDGIEITRAHMGSDNKTIFTLDLEGRIRSSTIRAPVAPAALRGWLDETTTATIVDNRPLSAPAASATP